MPDRPFSPRALPRRAAGAAALRAARWFAVPLCLGLLAGCGSGGRCGGTDQPYLSARDLPLLRPPEGMDAPDRSAMLTIPESPAGPPQLTIDGRCLDAPPSYFGSAGAVAGSAEEALAIWASAWAARKPDAVRGAYSTRFQAPGEVATADWLEQRAEQVTAGPVPAAQLDEVEIATVGSDQRVARFVQRFGENAVRKEVVLVREGGTWRIVSERVIEVL